MSILQVLNLDKGSHSIKLTLVVSEDDINPGQYVLTDTYELDKCVIQFKVIRMYLSEDENLSFFICCRVTNKSIHDSVVSIYIRKSKVTLSASSNMWTEIYQIKNDELEIDLMASCDHLQKESSPLKSIYEDDKLLDFKIFVDGSVEGVGFHRAVLSAWSPVFLKMFTGPWKEKHEGEVELPVTIDVVQTFKKFLYMEELPTDLQTLLGLVELGSYYMIPKLETGAIEAVSDITNTKNFNEILEYSYVKKLSNLTAAMLMKCKAVDKNLDLKPIVQKLRTLLDLNRYSSLLLD